MKCMLIDSTITRKKTSKVCEVFISKIDRDLIKRCVLYLSSILVKYIGL
jgi:hypothetical protein